MATTTAQLRQALEDMVYANIIAIFLIKYGEKSLTAGDNTVTFSGDAYDSSDDYSIRVIEALDGDGIDVKGELEIKNRTTNGFVVNAYRSCSFKWQTSRKEPKINFHT